MLKLIARRLRNAEEGFTLIELLVVVAIIALLATFAAPKLFDAINKAKEAPGQADLATISAALDRYYMDNSRYPDDLTDLNTGATGLYLKATATFANGYKKGYFYGTTATGDAYVLLDPKNTSAQVTSVCGSGISWTPGTAAVSEDALTKAQIDACATPTGMVKVQY